jgi:hypothetical protein
MIPKKQKLLPGTKVKVRSVSEIISTLDQQGTMEALPFMPEMARYCGAHFRVSKRIERTCEEFTESMRRIQNVVYLDDLTCDGAEHGGCQKECKLLWKEAWLERSDNNTILPHTYGQGDQALSSLPCILPDGRYICQFTELVKATTPFSPFDLTSYIRDIRSKTYSIPKLIRILSYAIFLRLRYYLTGIHFRFLSGQQGKTPSESLNLQPGEWVQVRTKGEIEGTLDSNGKNRGLLFTTDMARSCGKTYRVRRKLEKGIIDQTQKLREMKNTVILEDCFCGGCHMIRGGCPRENYHWWREIWLRRIPCR